MTEVAGVDVDVGFCASGEKCFAFRNDAEMTIGGHLNRPVEECGTHVLVGKKSREERGGRKCKGCGVWEWEVEGRPNTCTDQNYRENRKKYAGLLYFGETKDETATPNASKLDTAMNALCGDVGGVRIARIIGKKNGIAAKGELMTEELEGVLNKDGDVFLGIGLGAGSVCEICEQNMTCWDCGK